MQNNDNKQNKELPYFLSSNNSKHPLKISKRKILPYSNIANYLLLIEKSNLDETYFYSENLQKIISSSVKLK